MDWHKLSGYAVLTLCCSASPGGSSAARRRASGSSWPAPSRRCVIWPTSCGANPTARWATTRPAAGWCWSCCCCAVQAGTGLFSNDDALTTGPLVDTCRQVDQRLAKPHPPAEFYPHRDRHRGAYPGGADLCGAEAARPGATDADRAQAPAHGPAAAAHGQPVACRGAACRCGRSGRLAGQRTLSFGHPKITASAGMRRRRPGRIGR